MTSKVKTYQDQPDQNQRAIKKLANMITTMEMNGFSPEKGAKHYAQGSSDEREF